MSDQDDTITQASQALSRSEGREFTTEDYFKTQPRPSHLDDKTKAMDEFVARWSGDGKKRVVLVTVS